MHAWGNPVGGAHQASTHQTASWRTPGSPLSLLGAAFSVPSELGSVPIQVSSLVIMQIVFSTYPVRGSPRVRGLFNREESCCNSSRVASHIDLCPGVDSVDNSGATLSLWLRSSDHQHAMPSDGRESLDRICQGQETAAGRVALCFESMRVCVDTNAPRSPHLHRV